jgi:hypothetical protein
MYSELKPLFLDLEFVTRDSTLQDTLEEYSEEHLLRYEEYNQFVEENSG